MTAEQRTGSGGFPAVGGLSTVQPAVSGRVSMDVSSEDGSWMQPGDASRPAPGGGASKTAGARVPEAEDLAGLPALNDAQRLMFRHFAVSARRTLPSPRVHACVCV